MFKKIGLQQTFRQPAAIDRLDIRMLEPLLQPFAAVPLRKVHKFRGQGPAVDAPGLGGKFAGNIELFVSSANGAAERMEIGLHVSPAAKQFEDPFALQG